MRPGTRWFAQFWGLLLGTAVGCGGSDSQHDSGSGGGMGVGGAASTSDSTIGSDVTQTDTGGVSNSDASGTAGSVSASGGVGASSGGVGASSGGIGASSGGIGASSGGIGASSGGIGASSGGIGASSGGIGASSGGIGASSGGIGASSGGVGGMMIGGSSAQSTGGTSSGIGGSGGAATGGSAQLGGNAGTSATTGTGGSPNVPENCIKSGWCWENPVPGGSDLRSVWAIAPNDVWAVGNGGHILHYDGNRWRRAATPSNKTLYTVWASGPNDVWIGGSDGAFQWNGASWLQLLKDGVLDIQGTGPGNVRLTTGSEAISYFDGAVMRTPAGTSGFDDMVWSVWTFEPYYVFGAGMYGSVIRGDGNAAPSYGPTLLYRTGGSTLNDMWGTTKAEPLWAVGDSGQVVNGIGSSWATSDSGTSASLHGVWGSSQQDIWAVGDAGTIIHYDGFSWSNHAITTRSDFYDVSGTGPNDVWIVGSDGLILHNTGNGWSAPNALSVEELTAVSGTSDDDVWAVGDNGTALHRDASGWHLVPTNLATNFTAIWGSGPNDYWIAATDQHLYHWDGVQMEERYTAYVQTILWGTSANDVWSTGGGQIHHFDGNSWSIVTHPFNSSGDVWTDSPNDFWITQGSEGYWRRLDGTWIQGKTPRLAKIWGASANEIYGCFDYPTVSFQRWNGSSWTSSGGATRCSNPRDMHGNAGNNVWVAASAGQSYHWDGTTFTAVTAMSSGDLDADLNGVWVSPTGRVYMVGTAGTIIVHESAAP